MWAGAIAASWLAGAGARAQADPAAELALSLDDQCAPAASGAPLGVVTGRAFEIGTDLDLVVAIDTSQSTAARAAPERRGWRRWLAWLLPERGRADSADRFALEIERALELLERVDPRTTRVGVVAFAGDLDPITPDAWVAAPLGVVDSARAALRALGETGPRGGTDLIAALDGARAELLGELGARSRTRPGARRALLLLTDGIDVHPLQPDAGTARALLRDAVGRARAADIDVDVVALATAPTPALAGVTDAGGRLHLGRGNPTALESGAGIEVALRNASTGVRVIASSLSDGRFAALVPLVPGSNPIEVHARALSGGEARAALDLEFGAGSPLPGLEALRTRNQVLAAHLRAARAARRPSRDLVIEAAGDRRIPSP
jgi:hypothetical protein